MEASAISELQKRLQIDVSLASPEIRIKEESEDAEFVELTSRLIGENASSNEQVLINQVILVLSYSVFGCI